MAIQTKIVLVESLEQLAGLAVAKVRSALICPCSKRSSKLTLILVKLQALKVNIDAQFCLSYNLKLRLSEREARRG